MKSEFSVHVTERCRHARRVATPGGHGQKIAAAWREVPRIGQHFVLSRRCVATEQESNRARESERKREKERERERERKRRRRRDGDLRENVLRRRFMSHWWS